MSANNNYCTSVGIYGGYDKDQNSHIVTVRMPGSKATDNNERFQTFYLDEYQFMVWFVCHGNIIPEESMYEDVSELWYACDVLPKKPIIRAYKELMEMDLLWTSQAADDTQSLNEISTRIQPFVISLHAHDYLQKDFSVYKTALVHSVMSHFLPDSEKKIFRYFQEYDGCTFADYIDEMNCSKAAGEKELSNIGKDINSLLKKGYICPIGWSVLQ